MVLAGILDVSARPRTQESCQLHHSVAADTSQFTSLLDLGINTLVEVELQNFYHR